MKRPDSNLIVSYLLDTFSHPWFTLALGFGLGIVVTMAVLMGC